MGEEALTDSDDAPDLDRPVLAAEWETAVFEALSWSVTLDERLRHDLDGRDWTADFKGGGVVRALRYARNCVHHDWAAALDVGLGPDELVASHSTVVFRRRSAAGHPVASVHGHDLATRERQVAVIEPAPDVLRHETRVLPLLLLGFPHGKHLARDTANSLADVHHLPKHVVAGDLLVFYRPEPHI